MDAEQTRQAALAADRDLAASTTDFALQAAIAANRPDLVDALALNTSLYADLRTWVDEQLAGSAVQASEPAADQPGSAPEQQPPADALTSGAGTSSPAPGSETPVTAGPESLSSGAPADALTSAAEAHVLPEADTEPEPEDPELAAEPAGSAEPAVAPAVAAALAADADLATSTADFALQAAIAEHRPDLHTALSFNPLLYPDLRQWFETTGKGSAQAAGPAAQAADAAMEVAPTSTITPAALDTAPAGLTPVPVAVSGPGAPGAAGAPVPSSAASASQAWSGQPVAGASGPGEPPQPGTSTRLSRQRAWLAAAVVILLLVLVGGGTAWYMSSRDRGAEVATGSSGQDSGVQDESGQDFSGDASQCSQDPDLTVTGVEDTASGLRVSLEVSAACESGDVLSGAQNLLTLYAPSSPSGSGGADSVVALGHVDFSAAPVGVAPQGTPVAVTFASSQYFRPAAELSPSSIKAVLSLDRSGAQSTALASQETSFTASATADDAAQADSAAAAALTWQETKDYDTIVSRVNGMWVPQISSKRPGLVLNGETWDNRMVWEHYLRTRAVYPDALLLNSDSWSVFDAGGHWWVIIVAEPYSTPEGANGWCDAQGISKDDCFAKQISVGGSSKGTTKLR